MRETDPRSGARRACRGSTRSTSGTTTTATSTSTNQPETEAINRQMFIEWYPADHVQPAPDRPGRDGAVRPAVPRPVQLQPTTRSSRWGSSWSARRSTTASSLEGKAGARVARTRPSYSTWFNGGVRTTTDFHNQIGHPDGNHRQPDADGDPVRSEPPAARHSNALADRAAAVWHSEQSIDYLITAQPRDPRHRLAACARTSCSTSTGWGRTPSSAAARTTGR